MNICKWSGTAGKSPLKHQRKWLTLSFGSFYCVVQYVKSIATKLSVKTIRNEFIVNVTSLFRGSTVTVKSLSLQGQQSQSWQRGENSPAENIILRPCHFRERPCCVQSNKQPLSTVVKLQIKSCELFIVYTEQCRTRSPL